ncbi:MAG: VWA domain-containing protein [Bacteroidetes bacterium]|nr:VWA domain-containing protein [Bacteroidota bacterium]MBK8363761.1 VWA domain-containing protein [Bacteroidota bacterium]MBK9413292.1 VWA domain-containing protein [Bacteroidota bacterium]MBP6427713.1 VWA domain-containing protein [Bacteroidia bacterium]
MKFANPYFFLLFLLIPVMIAFYFFYLNKKRTQIQFSGFENFDGMRPSFRQRFHYLPFVLKLLAFSLAIVALARPQSSLSGRDIKTEGIDIMMALDISSSMLAEDLKPNRIEAAKKVAEEFIDSRPNDRIGLVVFGGESFTQCPLTTDHSVLKNLFAGIQSGILADGTAIGEGLGTAVNRIRNSRAKSKVVILLTDGVNNIGSIAPETAGEIAKTFGIRVYTIGVGTRGMAPYPVKSPFGIQYQNVEVQIDEPVLKKIAGETDGKYFRATNTGKLKEIYSEIDKLEKTKIDVTEFHNYTEEFYPLALGALLLLVLDILLRFTLFKKLP